MFWPSWFVFSPHLELLSWVGELQFVLCLFLFSHLILDLNCVFFMIPFYLHSSVISYPLSKFFFSDYSRVYYIHLSSFGLLYQQKENQKHRVGAYKPQTFIYHNSGGWEFQNQDADRFWWWPVSWLIDDPVLIITLMVEQRNKLSEASFINTNFICEDTLHNLITLKAPPPNIIMLGIRFHNIRILRGCKYSVDCSIFKLLHCAFK